MKHKLLALFIAHASVNCFGLSGKVIDENGEAIAGAKIEVVGNKDVYRSDEQGHFTIPLDTVDEIHLEADGFSHKILHLHHKHDDTLTVTLARGALEVVDVVGVPQHFSKIESAQPVSVLAGATLRKRQASTLGETLKNEVGVQSSYYGGVVSSPIIRGLDGPRVLVTQNSLDVSDVSRVGPDHVVAVEAVTAKQIEILRGPASLFFGSGAIGGVVNVVDERVPSDSEKTGALLSEYNSVNDETVVSGAYTDGNERFAFHADGFWRDSNDYDIPGLAELETEEEHEEEDHEEHEGGSLENSSSESSGFNLGGSLLLDNGYVGLSYGRLDRLNGIPGHGHEDEHEEEHEEEEEHEDEEHGEEETILSDLEQDRWQLLSELQLQNGFFSGINTRLGYTDYEHAEIHEGEDEEGTVFKSTTSQLRVDLLHREWSGWKGAFTLEAKQNAFEAQGEEAFAPPSDTDTIALALVEERHAGKVLWQWGARIEQVSLSAEDVELGGHEEHEEENEEEESDEEGHIEFDDFEFTPLSVSAGLVWDFSPGYNLGLSLAHAERAPSAAELFSAGPHIATRIYELGALFEIHREEDGEYHIEYRGEADKETSNNIDFTLRKFEGNIGFVFNLFYNSVSNFYFLSDSGLTTEDVFHEEEGEEDAEEDEHGEVLPVHVFQQEDVSLTGLELEFAWQLNQHLKWTVWGDTVSAELDNGENLPRTPPTRLATLFNYDVGAWEFEVSGVHHFEQTNTAPEETETDAYTMVDARISYTLPIAATQAKLYFAANNLGDEEARVHTSFLKDQAPLPGRNLKLGVLVNF
ncbi:MAG: TonB-dependent receptor [Cellvibrionaceae bacterium]|nr:TonB-dependent receptor [Cellvibrionaceae bacterium]